MMYAMQRCPSIPLCDHAACSTPWPSLPHRACQPKQAAAIGASVRRSRSTRDRSRDGNYESFSAVALPRHAASRRHFSQSAVPSSSYESQLSYKPSRGPQLHPERIDSIPNDRRDAPLPRLHQEPSTTSIKVNYDEDERERLSECNTEFESYMEDELSTLPPLSQRNLPIPYHVPSVSTKNAGSSPPYIASVRRVKTMSMPLAPPSAFIPRTSDHKHDRAARTRSLFMLKQERPSSTPHDVNDQVCSSPHTTYNNEDPTPSPTPNLQPSPTFTRTRAIKFGLSSENLRGSRVPTGASPPLRLFPITQPASPTGSLDSSRTASTCGGTTITSMNSAHMYNKYLQQNSVFEDDDDEKKGLMEYLRLGKKGEKESSDDKQRSKWRRVFCCFSDPEG